MAEKDCTHTPTPWTAEQSLEEMVAAAYLRGFDWGIENGPDRIYVMKAAYDYADKTTNGSLEQARFANLFQAVQSHASLLRCAEALRKALPFIDDALDAHTVMSETCVTQECKAVVDEANAALSSLEKSNG